VAIIPGGGTHTANPLPCFREANIKVTPQESKSDRKTNMFAIRFKYATFAMNMGLNYLGAGFSAPEDTFDSYHSLAQIVQAR
jgi:hypothetical protein